MEQQPGLRFLSAAMPVANLPLLLLASALLLLASGATQAQELVVIAHPASGLVQLSNAEARHLFLGRYKRLPAGTTAHPIDTTQLKERFYARLVGKPLAEIDAYWARLVFSGNTRPPEQLPDSAAVVRRVEQTPGAVGYVTRDAVSPHVRIVLALEATP
jgi:hypothetical protein